MRDDRQPATNDRCNRASKGSGILRAIGRLGRPLPADRTEVGYPLP
jgi:hypothetical protein